jgi:RHS repeat-associated protein
MRNPFRYTARELDSETGLYYYRARYYEPSIGRFLSEDPLRFGGGAHFFKYAKNIPVDLVDPYGLKVQKCCRNTQINWWVDFFSQLTGLKHCFLKTDTIAAGMGPANGGGLPACPLNTETAVTNHSQETIGPGECVDVPNVDESCVNNLLKVGKPTGKWTPINQCNSFVTEILNTCSKCKATYPDHEHFMSGW